MKKYSILIYSLLFIVLSHGSLFPQSAARVGIKIGGEFKDYLSGKNESFTNDPDYEIGLFNGIKLFNDDKNAFFLKLELNYVKLVGYRIDHVYHLTSWRTGSAYVFTEDERFTFPFVELGIIPEYFYLYENGTMLSIFLGPSLGLGSKQLKVKNQVGPLEYDLFDEYDMGYTMPVSLNAGVNYYYKIFFAGIKYRYCNVLGGEAVTNLHKISLLLGFAFQ
jgi:hypothetical protein